MLAVHNSLFVNYNFDGIATNGAFTLYCYYIAVTAELELMVLKVSQGRRHQQVGGWGGDSWNPYINNMHGIIHMHVYVSLIRSLFEPWEIYYVKLNIKK